LGVCGVLVAEHYQKKMPCCASCDFAAHMMGALRMKNNLGPTVKLEAPWTRVDFAGNLVADQTNCTKRWFKGACRVF
jgi:hypothetical protein